MAEPSSVEGDSKEAGPSETTDPIDTNKEKRIKLSRKRNKRVKRLEKKLELYQRKIRQTMEMEVTLDEMETDTSPYLKEDLIKRKFVKVWHELCDVVGISPEIQESGHHHYSYESTSYPEINRRVERLLRLDEFPDYWDVCQLVNRVNEKHSLGIKEKESHLLSRKIFREVGDQIKQRRQQTYSQLFGSHLTDITEEDPALKDPILLEQLTSSEELGRKRLEEMFDEFALRQEKEGDKTDSSSEERERAKRQKCDDTENEEQTGTDQETSNTGESHTSNGVEGIGKSSDQFEQDDTVNETAGVESEIDCGGELVSEGQDMPSERPHVVSEKESNNSPIPDQVIVNDSCDSDVIVISD